MSLSSRYPIPICRNRAEATGLIKFNFLLVLALLWWVPFQDLILAFSYNNGMPSSVVITLTLAKDIIIILTAAYIIGSRLLTSASKAKLTLTDFLVLMLGITIVFYGFLGESNLSARLGEGRAFLLPLLLYTIGRILPFSNDTFQSIIKHITWITLLICIFGLAERFLLPPSFWSDTINIGSFLREVKGMEGLYYIGDLPGNFYRLFIRRLVGPFGDPLFMSYFLILPLSMFVAMLLETQKRMWFSLAVIVTSITMLLTVSRGAILAFAAGTLLYGLVSLNMRIIAFVTALTIGTFMTFGNVILTMVHAIITGSEGSARGHADALDLGLEAFVYNLQGLGLGMAGTVSGALGEIGFGNTENAFLNLGLQVGILGLCLFLLLLIACFYRAHIGVKAAKKTGMPLHQRVIIRTVAISTLAYSLSGLMSPQIWAFKSIVHWWILLGAAITLTQKFSPGGSHVST